MSHGVAFEVSWCVIACMESELAPPGRVYDGVLRKPMNPHKDPQGYDSVYEQFNSPVMQKVREEAYGEDIGQHSWVTAEELTEDITRLQLSGATRLMDLGCGPCGPLTFIVARIGCHATGADSSAEAIAAGKLRAASLDLDGRVHLIQADLNEPVPFPDKSFEAILSLDVVLHLRDRFQMFQEVARVLAPGGRFLFTDAAVLTGAISDDEVQRRATFGPVQFAPSGLNETLLADAGLLLLEQHDRTASLLRNASGRIAARKSHQAELEKLETPAGFARQQTYLETVLALSQRGALSRRMYLAELPGK